MRKKRDFTQQTIQNVHMGKGTVSVYGFKMNVYCFVVDGVLIDTGAKSLERELLPFFEEKNIDQVVITHSHEDHIGNAGTLQQKFGLPVFMSPENMDECRQKARYPLYRKFYWGKRPPFYPEPIKNTFSSNNFRWKVIKTPGHAIDHLAFLNRDTGQLFTGDLYCQAKTRVVLREESVPTIIDSLKKVLTYDFQEVFCNHAGYIKDGRAALQRKLNYLQDLQKTILELYNKGMTPREITKTVFPKKYPITAISLGEWSSLNIVNSVIQKGK